MSVSPSSKAYATLGAGVFQLTADVTNTDATDVVGEGTVTFTITDALAHVIDTVSNVPVVGGQAVHTYVLPAGTPVGGYTVAASYSGTADYAASSVDTSAPLNVTPATTATSVDATPSTQPFAAAGPGTFDLTANVSNADVMGDVVGEGTVTFTITDAANHVIDRVLNVPVIGGQAAASEYSLPAGTPVGNYAVAATYSGSSNYSASASPTSASLAVAQAQTATLVSVMPNFSRSPCRVPAP